MRTATLRHCGLTGLLIVALMYAAAVRQPETSAQTPTFNVRQMNLVTNDLIYHAATNRIYASVPSAAGRPWGNTVAAIDPARGEIVSSVYVGSEPGRLALSSDGQQLYVTLDGAAAIRRIELGSFTAGIQFTLGKSPQDGPLYAQHLAAIPGQPQTLAVVRQVNANDGELVVFDQQTPRPQTLRSSNGGLRVVAATDANKLFALETGPFSSPSLMRLNLDNSGVTVAQRVANLLPSNEDFRFLRGKLYSASGRVINAEPLEAAGNLGDFGTGNAIAADETAGRIYLLTGGGSVRTLRAFDANTLMQLGALDVPGINGVSSSLVRWGTNGLAFRTSAGQVMLVQTLMVSTSQPIPTVTPLPLPSPTPPPPAFSLRTIPLAANDLAFDARRGVLYASVPSTGGFYGNSLAPIDPVTGAVGAPIWAGSEPGKLALSENGQFLYVALDGARSVRRFDLAALTFGAPFPLLVSVNANDPSFGRAAQAHVSALRAVPARPESVAVVKAQPNVVPSFDALEIYDNGVRRNTIFKPNFGGPGSIAFGTTAARLYGNDLQTSNGFYQLNANAEGVSGQVTSRGYAGGDIAFHEGLVYAANGQIVEPESLTLRGRFNASGSSFLLDAASNRVYFLGGTFNATTRTLSAFALDTLLPIGNHNLANIGTDAGSLVRWGANGLAFRTTNQIVLLQSQLVTNAVPVPTPSPVPSLRPAPTPTPVTISVRSIDLPANDLVYDNVARLLYAAVPASGGARANTLTPIVPETGALRTSIRLNDSPAKLAISRDSKAIYVATLSGNAPVRRFDTVAQTLGEPFALSSTRPVYVRDMEVVPGDANALVVLRDDNIVAAYDNGTVRPAMSNGSVALRELEFGATAANLYGHEASSASRLYAFTLSTSGISLTDGDAIGGFTEFSHSRMLFENGLLYTSAGQVFDPEARQPRGVYAVRRLGFEPPGIVVSTANNRVLFFTMTPFLSDSVVQIQVFDQQTFLPLQTITLPSVPGPPSRVVRWGSNGVALLANNRVYLLNLSLLEPSGSGIPVAPTSVSAANFQPVMASSSLVAAFGTQLAATTQSAATLPLPTTLAGTRVSIRSNSGVPEQLASLLFVSPTQINYVLPNFLPVGQATMTVTTGAGLTFTRTLQIENVAPGLFAANANGQGVAAALALRIKADGSQSYEPLAQFEAANNRFVARPLDLGPATDQVFLVLFGTGLRQRSALSAVNATIGGTAAQVLFAGAQGELAGLDQVNVTLPRSLAGRGEIEVALTVDGKAANPVRIHIR